MKQDNAIFKRKKGYFKKKLRSKIFLKKKEKNVL